MECHYCAVGLVHLSCLVGLRDSLQLDLRPTLNGIPDSLGGRSAEDPAPSASMRILESGSCQATCESLAPAGRARLAPQTSNNINSCGYADPGSTL